MNDDDDPVALHDEIKPAGLVSRGVAKFAAWLDGLRSSVSSALTLRPVGLAALDLTAHPPNWIQTNLAPRGLPNRLA